ncbi:hypothetical protein [Actinomycetospora aeridis]|uniref:Uncharacterized protein n=1 Tax=Actinomycetospora aeridis TaxID=3129231 RepID=A0ABU8N160_9PSEU
MTGRALQWGYEDGLRAEFGFPATTEEQRARARLFVAEAVPRTGGTVNDLMEALAMLGLVDEQGRPT